MSREVKRVPLDFDWPLNKVWQGYLMPDRLNGDKCPDCVNGYSPEAQHLYDLWYGKEPFHPSDAGLPPIAADHPTMRARAERNINHAPDYYGTGEVAIAREAERLADLFNGALSHHLVDEDVAALVEAGRLHDFTHTWTKEAGWQPNEPMVIPSAERVNDWSLDGFGHDSINAHVVIRARCQRLGVADTCATCDGHASVERYPGQCAEADAWERTDPPTGPGWQLWETVSEGSPVTPVFSSADGLISHLVDHDRYRLSAAQQLVADGSTVGTFQMVGMEGKWVTLDSARDADILDALGGEDL
jgi:hypothetical protein